MKEKTSKKSLDYILWKGIKIYFSPRLWEEEFRTRPQNLYSGVDIYSLIKKRVFEQARREIKEEIQKSKAPKILIFDNDPFLLDLIVTRFNDAGFNVKGSVDYMNVVEIVDREKPDVVYCSMIMPGIDGFQAIEMLKKNEKTKDFPIFVVTNLDQKSDIEKARELGIAKYLIKAHYTPTEMIKIFKEFLEKKAQKTRKPKILIFEQDPFLQDLYSNRFPKAGFEFKGFITYDDVVEIVAKERPDILYCELIMAPIDGFEAIGLLKKDERTKNIPIIIMTNLDLKEDIEMGFKLGAVKYLILAHHTPTEVIEIFKNYLIETGKFSKEYFGRAEKEYRKEKEVKKIIQEVSTVNIPTKEPETFFGVKISPTTSIIIFIFILVILYSLFNEIFK